jgi:CheY-like chemotaxis protein
MSTHEISDRALVVDDDAALLRAHVRALENKGFRVEAARDGAAALRALEAASFDVILSDIDMPGMNGMDLLDRVRAKDLDVPVVRSVGSSGIW